MLSITMQFGSGTSDLSGDAGADAWRSVRPGEGVHLYLDASDIRDGADPATEHKQVFSRNAQDTNDLMALMDFIAMLAAIFSQLLGNGAGNPPQPDDDRIGGDRPVGARGYSKSAVPDDGDIPVDRPGDDHGDDSGYDSGDGEDRKPQPVVNAAVKPDTPAKSPDGVRSGPGISPNSTQLVSTGTGTGHYFNVTNNTDREQTFAFSSNSSNTSGYSNHINGVMTLKPGETGTFEAGDDVPGIRINTSGPNGETHGNEALYEDTIQTNPMGGGGIVHNPDVSDVAGKLSYDGRPQRITVSDGTRSIGDGTETGVYDYDVEDTDPNRATNPMNMALNPASSYDIVFTDG